MRLFLRTLLVIGVVFPMTYSALFAQDLDARKIIETMDRLYRSDSSFSQVEMTIVNPNWERKIDMMIWAKGMEKTFIRILSPKKDRGVATLKSGTEMWNYFPKIDKVMKIPPSMMMGSWMGSDFTNDDLVKESTFLDDYNFELLPSPKGEEDYYFVKLLPKEKTATVWGKIIAKVRKSDYIPVYQEYYDEDGKKVREMLFSDIKVLGGKKIPATMELIPLNRKGNKTVITYKKIEFDKGVDESVFTLRNLRKKLG